LISTPDVQFAKKEESRIQANGDYDHGREKQPNGELLVLNLFEWGISRGMPGLKAIHKEMIGNARFSSELFLYRFTGVGFYFF
jgi:hypothetical protein